MRGFGRHKFEPGSPTGKDSASVQGPSGAVDVLVAALRGSEDGFIRLGDDLIAISRGADILGTRVRAVAAGIAARIDDDAMRDLDELLTKPGRILDALRSGYLEELACLAEIDAAIRALVEESLAMSSLVSRLNVVSIHTLIVAAHNAAVNKRIEIFARDVRVLGAKLASLRDELVQTARAAMTGQVVHRDEIDGSLAELVNLNREEEEQVRRTIETVRSLGSELNTILGGVADYADNVNSCSNEIVILLQFHDIVRQRIEHVIEALARKGLTGGEIALQAAQTGSVVSEISTVSPRIAGACAGINGAMDSVLECIARDSGNPVAVGLEAAAGLLERMLDLLDRQDLISGKLAAMKRDLANSSDGIRCISDGIRQASDDLRLKAFNAMIMTVHLGESARGFEVLAREVQALSADVGDFVDHIDEVTDRIGALIERGSAGITIDAGLASGALRRRISGWVASFRLVREEAIDGMAAAVDEAACLAGVVRAACANSSVIVTLADGLKRGHEMLEIAGGGHAAVAAAAAADLQLTYTMNSEREVHQAFVEGNTENVAKEAAYGENVELF